LVLKKIDQKFVSKIKVYLSQINTTVGDLDGNVKKILREHELANKAECDLVIFHEMTICGYPCEDLWLKKYFIEECQKKILEICEATKSSKCSILLGLPLIDFENKKEIIRNSILLIEEGKVKKIINKKSLPNFGVFDEYRYFKPANAISTIEFRGLTLAILICEDLWHLKNLYLLQERIIDCVIVVNSSPYSSNKHLQRQKISQNFAKNLAKPLIYINQIGAQDSLVFDGGSFILDALGQNKLQMKFFEEDFALCEITKDEQIINVYTDENQAHRTKIDYELEEKNYSACLLGLRDYVQKNGFKKVLLGMSGGVDSALVATIAVDALSSENVSLYALPTCFNSEESMIDAKDCAKNLGINLEVISINNVFEVMKGAVENLSQLALENMQSRIRGNILMSISNTSGALLISTGNKSELACGYSTIYGDMCGAFNPIKDLYKTEVYQLCKWRNDNVPSISFYAKKNLILQNILTKAPTAELRENQKDSHSLPDYDILDKILFALIEEEKSITEIIKLGFSEDLVKKVAKLFYASEYKRKQAVLGSKISNKSFDKDRRYPITNKFNF